MHINISKQYILFDQLFFSFVFLVLCSLALDLMALNKTFYWIRKKFVSDSENTLLNQEYSEIDCEQMREVSEQCY